MRVPLAYPASLAAALLAGASYAQGPAKVDFARDVQPIFQQNCVSCHGPHKAIAGLRMDQRGVVEKPFARLISPGSSANSAVFHRIAGEGPGPTMPPTGDLKPEQIATVRLWIDQGALWPDELANDTPLPPEEPKATAWIDLLHEGQLERFEKLAAAEPAVLNARGPEGSTPLMFAALYADAPRLERLLRLGGDPNRHNDAGATALMWAVNDLAKTQILVAHGADVNAKSGLSRTPLMIAARVPGNLGVVRLLVEHGASLNPNAHPQGQSSPLIEASTAGDPVMSEYLIAHGADAGAAGEVALSMAILGGCNRCVALLAPKITDKATYTGTLQDVAYMSDVPTLKLLLDHGADVNAFDSSGRTPLMYAAQSDLVPTAQVKLLLEHGAAVSARSKHPNSGDTGMTALDMALQHGETPVVRLLEGAGATPTRATPVALNLKERSELQTAIADSLPLLQHADERFVTKSGCVSCHSDSLTAMTISSARRRGLPVDNPMAATQVKKTVESVASVRDTLLQGVLVPVTDNFGENVMAFILVGLSGEGYPGGIDTDVVAHYLMMRQSADGSWPFPGADIRPPLCLMHVGQTALAMRALQMYPPKTATVAARHSVALAARWLVTAQSSSNEDRNWRVMGLAWAGTEKAALQAAMNELLATQAADGGWSNMPGTPSDAYATGKSLVALQQGGLPTSNPAYQRGVKWLMRHQAENGSWYLQTRALGFQPAFDAEFPGSVDQWISNAATNWATMALALTLPETGKPLTASPATSTSTLRTGTVADPHSGSFR